MKNKVAYRGSILQHYDRYNCSAWLCNFFGITLKADCKEKLMSLVDDALAKRVAIKRMVFPNKEQMKELIEA